MKELEVKFKPNSKSTCFPVHVLLFLQICKWLHIKLVKSPIKDTNHTHKLCRQYSLKARELALCSWITSRTIQNHWKLPKFASKMWKETKKAYSKLNINGLVSYKMQLLFWSHYILVHCEKRTNKNTILLLSPIAGPFCSFGSLQFMCWWFYQQSAGLNTDWGATVTRAS